MGPSTHSGVCHSDYSLMMNKWKTFPYPTQAGQVGGHEGVGKVVAFGPGAESTGLKIGDRVGVKWVASCCGTCRMLYLFPIPLPPPHLKLHLTHHLLPNLQPLTTKHHTNPPPHSTMPRQQRRTLSKSKNIRLLHTRNIPTIRRRPGHLRNENPRVRKIRRRSTISLRRNYGIFRVE